MPEEELLQRGRMAGEPVDAEPAQEAHRTVQMISGDAELDAQAIDLVVGSEAAESDVGLALAAVSLMAVLGAMKRRVGRAMDSRTPVADSTETLRCSYLSAILLAGLVLNATRNGRILPTRPAVLLAIAPERVTIPRGLPRARRMTRSGRRGERVRPR